MPAGDADAGQAAPRVSGADLDEVRRFREVGYRLALAATQRDALDAEDRDRLNRWAAAEPIRLALGAAEATVSTGTTAQVLSSVARSLILLLGGAEETAFRQCDGSECTRFFVDRSRAQNRRFCSDRLCGNRAKVAAFRERARSAPPREPDQHRHDT